jgi:retron-type reverse transcriptase
VFKAIQVGDKRKAKSLQKLILKSNEELRQTANNWKHSKIREIPIPKKDGKTRILKVPTIADRAWQCLVKYALEPAREATFHARSYGVRTGRSAHDAQKILFLNLSSRQKGIEKRVIELDIEKCFDRINHSCIMERLIAPPGIKLGIFRCLKTGVNPEFPEQGTPQGGREPSSDSRKLPRLYSHEQTAR